MASHGRKLNCLIVSCCFSVLLLPLSASRPQQPSAASKVDEDYRTFRAENGEWTFNHLAVDHRNGNVYLGAVNRIYKLSPSLEVQVSHQTGPDEGAELVQAGHAFPTHPVSRGASGEETPV